MYDECIAYWVDGYKSGDSFEVMVMQANDHRGEEFSLDCIVIHRIWLVVES